MTQAVSIQEFLGVTALLLGIGCRHAIAACVKAWSDYGVYMLTTHRRNKRELAELGRSIQRETARLAVETARIERETAEEQAIIDRHMRVAKSKKSHTQPHGEPKP